MPTADNTAQTKTRREQRERELAAKILALPEKRYGVLYVDPPYRWELYSRETGMDRAADNHYTTMKVKQIKAIDVASIAAPDCVLFLWATAPMLPQVLEIMAAWGLSQAMWDKGRQGTGYWFWNHHELLLVGTRGKVPCPAPGTQWPSILTERRAAHSVKPERAYELIKSYFTNLPKIELFARRARAGWSAWGAEAPPATEAAE